MKGSRSRLFSWFCSAAVLAGLVLLPAATVPAAAGGCCGGGMVGAMSHAGHGGSDAGSLASTAPTASATKTDADPVKEQKAIYPLDTCLVSGEKLGGEMGAPVDYVHQGRLVRFCCKSCIGKFQKDPAKYLKTLDASVVKAQKDKYPLSTCVVSGEKLGDMGEPIDYVYQGRLVRFCCGDCIDKFKENPEQYLKNLGVSTAPAGDPHAGHQHGS